MIVDKKFYDLLEYLVQNKNIGTITSIAQNLSQNRRVIYYNLDKLNDEIAKNNECEKILNKSNVGIVIDEKQQIFLKKMLQNYDNTNYFLNIEERKLFIAILISSYPEKITIDLLMDICFVSRNTIVNDLKDLKESIKNSEFNVSLEVSKKRGYFLLGSDLEVVQYVYYIINELYCYKNDKLKYLINNVFFKKDKMFTTSFYVNLVFILEGHVKVVGKNISISEKKKFLFAFPYIVMAIRKVDFALHIDEYEQLILGRIEYSFISEMTKELDVLHNIKLNKREKILLSIILLCLKKDFDTHNSSDDYKVLSKNIHTMIEIFENNSGVKFNNKEKFADRLITHFKSLLFRKKYNIVTNNKLTSKIISNYKDVYLATKLSVRFLESLYSINFTKSDIAYISLHFGSEIVNSKQEINKIKKVLIVTEELYSIQNLIEKQCKYYLPNCNVLGVTTKENINEYEAVDFIISTEFLEVSLPYVLVSPLITTEDIEKIINFKNNIKTYKNIEEIDKKIDRLLVDYIKDSKDIAEFKIKLNNILKQGDILKSDVKENKTLNEILTRDKIVFADNNLNLQNAITILSEPLLKENIIFFEDIYYLKKSIYSNSNYSILNNDTLLLCVKSKNSRTDPYISVLQLKNSIALDNVNIKFVVLVTTVNNMAHLSIISELEKYLLKYSLDDFIQEICIEK